MNNLCNRRRSGSIFLCKTLTATLALDRLFHFPTVDSVLAVRGAEVIWRRRCAGDWRTGAGVRRMEVRAGAGHSAGHCTVSDVLSLPLMIGS